ncbi:hypothetical protein JS562_26610 [Agrobacterium sp. S2]|nr:hypothetical protein [Agrobacterium sp. S2]
MPKSALDHVIDEYINERKSSPKTGELYQKLHGDKPLTANQIKDAHEHINGLSNLELIELLDKAGLLLRKDD